MNEITLLLRIIALVLVFVFCVWPIIALTIILPIWLWMFRTFEDKHPTFVHPARRYHKK